MDIKRRLVQALLGSEEPRKEPPPKLVKRQPAFAHQRRIAAALASVAFPLRDRARKRNGDAEPAQRVPREGARRAEKAKRLTNAPRPLPLRQRKRLLARKLSQAGVRQPFILFQRKDNARGSRHH